ncbi:MAG TPA: hypothetical protein VIU11_27735, partial [Nakamurella sp.]
HTADLLLGMWELLQQLGRVPRRLIWDNESGIGRGKRHAEGVGAFTGTLATTLQRLKPYDPESKGIVERRNGFFETSFMPGRDFTLPADFDAQFTQWLSHHVDQLRGPARRAGDPSRPARPHPTVGTAPSRPATRPPWRHGRAS